MPESLGVSGSQSPKGICSSPKTAAADGVLLRAEQPFLIQNKE